MDKKLKRRLDILTGYAVISLLVFVYLAFVAFVPKNRKENLDELTVRRINLVGEDGSLRMVISNETRQHSGRSEGKELPKRKRPAGIIFFDNNGDECGGLVFGVNDTGKVITSGMSFTMDNYHNDQVVQVINSERYTPGKGNIRRGLAINEYPVGSSMLTFMEKYKAIQKIEDTTLRQQKLANLVKREGSKRRLFLGRNLENKSGLFLYDTTGNPRMKIYVDKTGEPKIEVLDSKGHIKKEMLQ